MQQPLEKNGSIIGSLEMHFKKQGIIDSFIADFFLFGAVFALQFIFLALIISLVYYQKIINPIKRLIHHSKLLSQHKLDESFDWDGHDEIGTLGVAMDQTRVKLKELFDNLKQENETLDTKVKQRTKELEDASRYKSEFLANMSHEIRTPMNAIMGMSHLMSKTAMNQTQTGYITKIKEASSVLLHIINDVLDFSKIEAIAFDLHKELKKSCSIFSVLAKEKI